LDGAPSTAPAQSNPLSAPVPASLEPGPARAFSQAEQRLSEARADLQALTRKRAAELDARGLAKLRQAASRTPTAADALRFILELPGPLAADLVYDVWSDTTSDREAAALARELSYTTELRSRASPALAALLELRAATSCLEVRRELSNLTKRADRRALSVLEAVHVGPYPCGPSHEDCGACVRGTTNLSRAIAAVKTRPLPAWFATE
jgi:hypothetical protein